MKVTIGFIGLGGMGLAVATNLLTAGFGLRVYNRTPVEIYEITQAITCVKLAINVVNFGIVGYMAYVLCRSDQTLTNAT